MNIREQFNRISHDYDAKRKLFIPCFDAFYEKTTDFITSSISYPKTVADFGAGTGLLTYYWHKIFPAARFVFVDIADGMLEIARQRFAMCENVSFEICDYNENITPYNFDVAISALSIHHLENDNKNRIFRNIYERLPEGGAFVNYDQFCASDPQINNLYSLHWETSLRSGRLTSSDLELWQNIQKLDRECSGSEEIRMLKASGFSSVECIFSYQKFSVILALK